MGLNTYRFSANIYVGLSCKQRDVKHQFLFLQMRSLIITFLLTLSGELLFAYQREISRKYLILLLKIYHMYLNSGLHNLNFTPFNYNLIIFQLYLVIILYNVYKKLQCSVQFTRSYLTYCYCLNKYQFLPFNITAEYMSLHKQPNALFLSSPLTLSLSLPHLSLFVVSLQYIQVQFY